MSGQGMRVDKWLWAARFYKTRSLAAEAVRGGHVELNGVRCKPARLVSPGDRLRIVRGQDCFEIEVRGLAGRRGPAQAARELYEESEASRLRREQLAEQRRLQRSLAPQRRPDKRQRRQLRRLRQE